MEKAVVLETHLRLLLFTSTIILLGILLQLEGAEGTEQEPHPWSTWLDDEGDITTMPYGPKTAYFTVNLENQGPGNLSFAITGNVSHPHIIYTTYNESVPMVLGETTSWMPVYVYINHSDFQRVKGSLTISVVDWEGSEPQNKTRTLEFHILEEDIYLAGPYIFLAPRYSIYYEGHSKQGIFDAYVYHDTRFIDNLTLAWVAGGPEGIDFENETGDLELVPGGWGLLRLPYSYNGSYMDGNLSLRFEALNWSGGDLPGLNQSYQTAIVSTQPALNASVVWLEDELTKDWGHIATLLNFQLENLGNVDLKAHLFANHSVGGLTIDGELAENIYYENLTLWTGGRHHAFLRLLVEEDLAPGAYEVNLTFVLKGYSSPFESYSEHHYHDVIFNIPAHATYLYGDHAEHTTLEPGAWRSAEYSFEYLGNVPDIVTLSLDNQEALARQNIRVRFLQDELVVNPGNEYTFQVDYMVECRLCDPDLKAMVNASSERDPDAYLLFTTGLKSTNTSGDTVIALCVSLVLISMVLLTYVGRKKLAQLPQVIEKKQR